MKNKKYFKLFANCIIVNGVNRSIICDIQLGNYIIISKVEKMLIESLSKTSIEDYLISSNSISKNHLDIFLKKLIENNIGFVTSTPECFPSINLNLVSPYKINDSIIELSSVTYKNINKILLSLSELGCQTIELRGYKYFDINKISKIVDSLKKTRVRNIEIYNCFNESISKDNYKVLLNKYPIINFIVVHSYNEGKETFENGRLLFTNQIIDSKKCCGNITKDSFRINTAFYIESINKNSCLNKKISISEDGSIRNCPSINYSIGKINNTSILKALNDKKFTKLWNINKDKVNICQECEFRYLCSDCRAYIENPFDIYSKPLKCGYDPYTNIWKKLDNCEEK